MLTVADYVTPSQSLDGLKFTELQKRPQIATYLHQYMTI